MFITIVIRNWLTNFSIFLVLMLITGCGIVKSPTSRSLVIKPFEEIVKEDLRKLRNAKELALETEITSKIIIPRNTADYNIEFFKATLNILPLVDSRQKILNLEIRPTGKIIGRSVEFKLEDPPPGRHEFTLKAEAKLKHKFVNVKDKISFPLQVIPKELINYTKPSLIIDSDDEEIQTLYKAQTSMVHEYNISRPEKQIEHQEGFCSPEETNPNPGGSKREQGKAGSCAQGKKKTSEKGRSPFLKTGHDLLVGYGEITSIFNGQKCSMELSVGKINLYSGQNLGCEQSQEKCKGWVIPSFHMGPDNYGFRD